MEENHQVGKISSFEQMIVWQKSQDLAVSIYELTKSFPKEEKFALIDQVRRAASSISANIAEGFGRRTAKDKLHFYAMAYGSLLETKNFIYLSERLSYIDTVTKEKVVLLTTDCQKLMNALMRSINA
jgi:four helix bundle protein